MNDKVIENIEYMINRTISQIDLLTKRKELYQKAIEDDLERLHEDLEEQKQLLIEAKK
mgnify:CR=1 FL=1|jgi:hypothetical protein